jgi:predicted RND superfamily exporter protein
MPLIPAYATDRFRADRLEAELQRHPVAAGQLISPDGRTLSLLVRIQGDSLAVSDISRVIDPLNRYAAEYQSATSSTVRLAGHPAVRVDVLSALRRAMMIGCTAAIAIGFVVAMLVFRHLPSVVISVAAPAIGTVWTLGLLAWNNVPISGLMTALPNLVFVIGLTDAVHLLLETQRQLHKGLDSREAVYNSLIRVGPACCLATLTTFLGFGSLALSRTESVQTFGLWAAVGTTFAMLAVVVVLPTILLMIPRKWALNDQSEDDRLGAFVSRLVQPTLKKPRLTTAIAVLLCLGLLSPAIRQKPDIIWTETMPRDSASVVAMDRADDEFGGALVVYLMVGWPSDRPFPDRRTLQATEDVHAAFRDSAGFTGPFSVRNVMAVAPGKGLNDRFKAIRKRGAAEENLLVSEVDRKLIVSARIPNDGSSSLRDRLVPLNQKIDRLRIKYPEYEFTLTGTAVAAAENMTEIIIDLARSLAIAAALIFLVLTIAFRSLRIGCLTIVPNILPLLVTAAGLYFLNMPLQITSALTFSLCLGLAVDDTIHVAARFRLSLKEFNDPQLAIQETIKHVGSALIVTTVILLGGFAAMLTSPMPGVQLFACLSGLTLITALIGDLFLFPAMLLWNWNAKQSKLEGRV